MPRFIVPGEYPNRSLKADQVERVLCRWLAGRGYRPNIISAATGLPEWIIRKHLGHVPTLTPPSDAQLKLLRALTGGSWADDAPSKRAEIYDRLQIDLGEADTHDAAGEAISMLLHAEATLFEGILFIAETLTRNKEMVWSDVMDYCRLSGLTPEQAIQAISLGVPGVARNARTKAA